MDVSFEKTRYADDVERLRAMVDEALASLVPHRGPAALYEPARYVLAGKGKRLRPVLLLLAAEVFDVAPQRALPAALAVEVCHNFTLVHDDIMDHADARRGRPTVHVKWDEDTAILCGDYLLTLAYDLLAQVETRHLSDLMHVFSGTVTRLCEGQVLDKAFETRTDVTVNDYFHMIDCKTGALLQGTLEMGGIIGEASDQQRAVLRKIGADVGRAFQIQDDLLDLVADSARWGKPIGGDLIEGKKTVLLLDTLERAEGEELSWFSRIIHNGGLPAPDVAEARRRMERLGVIEDTRKAVVQHTTGALSFLDELPSGHAVETLRWLVQQMQARLH